MVNNKTWLSLFVMTAIGYLAVLSFITFPLTTVIKPIPIVVLLLYVLLMVESGYKKNLLIGALVFSIGGDIALTLPLSKQLELGLGMFLIAHCFYIKLFCMNLQLNVAKFLLCAAIIGLSVMMLIQLWSHLGELLIPVIVYMIVLNIMAMTAVLGTGHQFITGLGAIIFLGSDSLIAINEFLYPEANLTLGIMLTYYLAQILIVTGVLSKNCD